MRGPTLAAALLSLLVGMPAVAQQHCAVTDPTGTPLNVRSSPNGPIVGALANGTVVSVAQSTLDGRGRAWSFVIPRGPGRQGWVFREFISCY